MLFVQKAGSKSIPAPTHIGLTKEGSLCFSGNIAVFEISLIWFFLIGCLFKLERVSGRDVLDGAFEQATRFRFSADHVL